MWRVEAETYHQHQILKPPLSSDSDVRVNTAKCPDVVGSGHFGSSAEICMEIERPIRPQHEFSRSAAFTMKHDRLV